MQCVTDNTGVGYLHKNTSPSHRRGYEDQAKVIRWGACWRHAYYNKMLLWLASMLEDYSKEDNVMKVDDMKVGGGVVGWGHVTSAHVTDSNLPMCRGACLSWHVACLATAACEWSA